MGPANVRRARKDLAWMLAVLAAVLPGAASAQEMRHRYTEHVLEAYFIGALGGSLTATSTDGELDVRAAWLQPQGGLGIAFPTNPHACLGLGAFGFELALGPAVALGSGLPTEFQVVPGLFIELSGDLPLQLVLRGSVVVGTARPADPGFSGAILFGWYARPMSFRFGFEYQRIPDRPGWLSGLRFEVLFLGADPIPP